MSFIWSTRGHDWGFRFLRDGGLPDPLLAYEDAFAGTTKGPTTWQRKGSTVAVRFPDPQGRKDAAGRLIPHEFVIFPPMADGISSVEEALEKLWPLVSVEYEATWRDWVD